MDRHELAMKTYNDIQKRKEQKKKKAQQLALQCRIDAAEAGWNRRTKYICENRKRYYNNRHSV
jgi:hypothetical protein